MARLNLISLHSKVECILIVSMDTNLLETDTVNVNQTRDGVDEFQLAKVSTNVILSIRWWGHKLFMGLNLMLFPRLPGKS